MLQSAYPIPDGRHPIELRLEREVSVSNGCSVTKVWEIIQEVSFETSKKAEMLEAVSTVQKKRFTGGENCGSGALKVSLS